MMYIVISVVRISSGCEVSEFWKVCVVFWNMLIMVEGMLIFFWVCCIVCIVLLRDILVVRLKDRLIVGNMLLWLICSGLECGVVILVMVDSGIILLFSGECR